MKYNVTCEILKDNEEYVLLFKDSENRCISNMKMKDFNRNNVKMLFGQYGANLYENVFTKDIDEI